MALSIERKGLLLIYVFQPPDPSRPVREALWTVEAVLLLILLCIFLVGAVTAPMRARAAGKGFSGIAGGWNYRTVYSGQKIKMNIRCTSPDKPRPPLTFQSSNERVAVVSGKGTIQARESGQAVITCRSAAGKKVRSRLTVRRRPKNSNKVIYLTYDDGPGHRVTPKLLRVLKKYDACATFFVVGTQAKASPGILRQEYRAGHTVAVHTYTHDYNQIYRGRNACRAYMRDFDKTSRLLTHVSGGDRPTLVRMPGGSNNQIVRRNTAKAIVRSLHKRGFRVFDWNAASNDAVGINYSTKQLTRFAIKTIKMNRTPVLLMHDTDAKTHTPQVTENVIRYFKKRGYSFESLDLYKGEEICFLN